MPVRKVPLLLKSSDSPGQPYLNVVVTNPHAENRRLKVRALIDTGADFCALPVKYAAILGHTLENGAQQGINTGGGKAVTFYHQAKIIIPDHNYNGSPFVTKELKIGFLHGLHTPVMGTRGFLEYFKLVVDYQEGHFSLLL
ncbi:MAG: hypothetical protein HQL69_11040 [Magnetococcales bacterium]|nr:hypothetical protein [Magnetococcales bacterium]